MKPACPLCYHPDSQPYFQDRRRHYWQCPACQLVFVDPAQRLNKTDEKAEYDLHQNRPDDPGYRRFLSRFYQPMKQRISSGDRGLGFGFWLRPGTNAIDNVCGGGF